MSDDWFDVFEPLVDWRNGVWLDDDGLGFVTLPAEWSDKVLDGALLTGDRPAMVVGEWLVGTAEVVEWLVGSVVVGV